MSDTPSDAAPPRRNPYAPPQPPRVPSYMGSPQPPHPAWPGAPVPPPPPQWVVASRAKAPAEIRPGVLWAALATALAAALLLGDGLGLNLLFVAIPAAVAAALAARAAGRRPRPWTLLWAVGGLALLAVPALRDAGWPAFLAIVAALALGSLALHGSRTWPGVLFGSVGMWGSVVAGIDWGRRGLRERTGGSRDRWWPVAKAIVVAVVLLVVFGALFAGADAAFADLLSSLTPDTSIGDSPMRLLFFVLALFGALAAARTAASPRRWDRIKVKPGRARSRVEWTLPLAVLAVLFAVFNSVQLTVLFGGYDKVLAETGLTYSQYARQGFWQLLTVTLLTVLVIALALLWAPRGADGDRLLVRSLLGAICALTLVVVASALRRMELYVDAYGLTRLRMSVAGVELWLGLVIVLIMAAGILGNRWLPRAVVAVTAAGILAFGLASPDALIADQQVSQAHNVQDLDLEYLRGLSADAVPALNRLPEPQRSCALEEIARGLRDGEPWYATSLGESRARTILADRPLSGANACQEAGFIYYRE